MALSTFYFEKKEMLNFRNYRDKIGACQNRQYIFLRIIIVRDVVPYIGPVTVNGYHDEAYQRDDE